MYTVHLGILGMVHNSTCIADIVSFHIQSIQAFYALHMKKKPIKQEAMDRSFLLDTVRHISRNLNLKIEINYKFRSFCAFNNFFALFSNFLILITVA